MQQIQPGLTTLFASTSRRAKPRYLYKPLDHRSSWRRRHDAVSHPKANSIREQKKDDARRNRLLDECKQRVFPSQEASTLRAESHTVRAIGETKHRAIKWWKPVMRRWRKHTPTQRATGTAMKVTRMTEKRVIHVHLCSFG